MNGKNFSAQELHDHIQAVIFGRPNHDTQRFDELQWKLHELADRPSDLEIVQKFVARVKMLAEQYERSAGSVHSWYPAITDALTQMEAEECAKSTTSTND